MELQRPDTIMNTLTAAGFAVYYVGGCVRDRLLGRPVHDWDLATSARPEEVLSLFSHCVPTGLRHGTVTVIEDGVCAEVTTFRAEGAYLDARRPSHIRFVSRIEDDLARRDFTINAMAMDAAGALLDPFGGQDDLRLGRIRCVGAPAVRFGEDALRMLRAYRFAAQLGFPLEAQTEAAVADCAPLCARLSAERVRDEMEKTLLSPHPEVLAVMADRGLLRAVGIDAFPALDALSRLECTPEVRWTGLKCLYPPLDPARLRLPGKLCAHIALAASAARPSFDRLSLKRCIADVGWPAAETAAALSGDQALFAQLRASGECATRAELAVSGRDFPELSGAAVGQMLRMLLEHVLAHPEDNTRERLLRLAREGPDGRDAD